MNKLTRKDQDMAGGDDPYDLPGAGPLLGKLMQPTNPELQKPPAGVAGAVEGGYVIPNPLSDEPLVFGLKGFLIHSVVFSHANVEWGPIRGGRPSLRTPSCRPIVIGWGLMTRPTARAGTIATPTATRSCRRSTPTGCWPHRASAGSR
jgi:hypothetical protein